MGVQDFDDLFDQLDSSQKGYVTAHQIQKFHSTAFDANTDDSQVQIAIDKVCGQGKEHVLKEFFFSVLEELERRREIESEAYWDFQGLDSKGNGLISLRHTFLLFQEYHAELFSLKTWQQFLKSRKDPDADVYFDELKAWLCDIPPDCKPSSQRQVQAEAAKLEQKKSDASYKDLQNMKQLLKNDDLEQQEQDEMAESIHHHTKRKLNKWNTHGLGAMLHDDGLGTADDIDSQLASKTGEIVTTNNVLDALDKKYSLLQDKIIMEMASFAANMDSEKSEIFLQIKRAVSKLIKEKTLSDKANDLQGARVALPMTLLGMMGDLRDAEAGRREEFHSLRSRLKSEGMSPEEVDKVVMQKYEEIVEGPQTCGEILAQLMKRYKAEREVILSSLHNNQDSLPSTVVLALEYWRLLRQLHLLQTDYSMTAAGLAVGIGERCQTFKPKRYDWDRHRSDTLAALRLEARKGHRPIKRSTAAPNLDSLQDLGSVGLKVRLVEEIEQQQYLEREAMIYLLQGHESKLSLDAASKMPSSERQSKMRRLRNQRQEWITGNKSDPSVNSKLLQEAIGLYLEERRVEIEAKDHNASEATVMAIVLSDLQQRQEVVFEATITELHKKTKADLTKHVLSEIEATKDEYFNNIAYIVLGCVEVSARDAVFTEALEGKYKALRDQVFLFGLTEKMGSAWRSLSKEEKQKEILKQRKEEKRLRGDGHLDKMEALIGPRSQALPPLSSLIGDDKVFMDSYFQPLPPSPPTNLLADMVPRFDKEQDALLSWLHSDEVKGATGKVKHIHVARMAAEKFAAVSEGDQETALLFVGLLERVSTAISGRSKTDRGRQLSLAQKRAALRKKSLKNGEHLRSAPEEKVQPKSDDDRVMQEVYLRAILRRHHKEREIMLSLLQDEGLDELVEAAALMSPDQAVNRIKELKAKRDDLDLDDKANEEEHTYILEEAGAIRCAGKKQAMCKSLGRAVLLEEVVTQLLVELQDLQDVEFATALTQLGSSSASDLQAKIWHEEKGKKNSHCHLIMKVFSKFDGDTSSIDFEELVEEKYRKLRNHLLNECLSQQHGEKAWGKMGQKQKNKLLSALSTKEATLWNEGNSESMSAWLNPWFSLQPSLPYLTGVGRHQYMTSVLSAENDVIPEDANVNASHTAGGETISFLHRRFLSEIDFVRNYIAGSMDVVPSDDEKQLLRNKLKWEMRLLDCVSSFLAASLVTGLAERQNSDKESRLQHDLDRYRLLGRQVFQGKWVQGKKSFDVFKGDDIGKLQEAVTAGLSKKHADEWQVLCRLMASSKFSDLKNLAAAETQQQRSDRLLKLHSMRGALDLSVTSEQMTILEEAVVVKVESRRYHLQSLQEGDISEDMIRESLIADLLQAQLCEAEIYLQAFVSEDKDELVEHQQMIGTELSQSHVTNIAEVIFSEEGGEDEGEEGDENKIKESLDGKYDALRDQLLIQALINEMGEAEWKRLSEKERQRLLLELKLKERQLRKEGKYDEAAALLGDMLNNDERLRKLLGDSKEEQERRLKERLERRRQRLAEGLTEEECDQLEEEDIAKEEEEDKQRRKNILLDLDHCHDKERDELLKRLRESGDERERQRLRQLEILRLRQEQRRLRNEDKYDAAAMLMGLSEENERKQKLTKEEERKRQQDLARQRLEMMRLRRMQGNSLVRDETIELPDGDLEDSTIEDTVLRIVDKRHRLEREILVKLLDESCEGQARDEVRILTDEELKAQLADVQELFNVWKQSTASEKEDGDKILADAAVFSVEAKQRDMQVDGELASDEDVKIALLAELQMIQDGEAAQMLVKLTDVDGDQKRQILNMQRKLLNEERHENVAGVLLAFANEKDIFANEDDGMEKGGDAQNKEEMQIVAALEKKYDAMKDKLLMEALIKQMGESEWARLTELERQRKLIELKKEERRLRKEGKMDEVAALLGQFVEDSEGLSRLLGQTEEDQKRRIQEKLALRKKMKEEREAQGLSVEDEELDQIVDEENKKIQRKNILENLDNQFDKEKAALLANLRQYGDHYQAEKERQLALAKLQRERRRLQQEDNFDSAAMIFAQSQQSDSKRQENLLLERDRQRQLAKDRLEASRKQRDAKKGDAEIHREEEDSNISEDITDQLVFLQESILSGVETLQANERDMLLTLVSMHERGMSRSQTLAKMSDQDLKLNLSKLQRDYEAWEKKAAKGMTNIGVHNLPPKKKLKLQNEIQKRQKEQKEILEQALACKFELEQRQLTIHHEGMTDKERLDEMSICALADLQEKQMAYLESVYERMNTMTEDQLRDVRKMQRAMNQEGWFKTLASSLFSVNAMMGEIHSREDLQGGLELEFEKKKQELLDKVGIKRKSAQRESIDIDGMLKELETQYNAKKNALESDKERQREMLRQRLAMRKQTQEDKEWDTAAMAGQIFAASEANATAVIQAKKGERGKQDDLLQQRLKARREAKRLAAEKSEEESLLSRESSKLQSEDLSRRSTMDSPMFGLSREKTVVDVQVSDDQKQAMYNQLVKQELKRQQQISAEQNRQEELLKQRLEARSSKRETEVAALFTLGERQKTILQQSQKDERERQIAQMKEKVSKMRESRSRSPTKIPE